jgi:hypothetical protein
MKLQTLMILREERRRRLIQSEQKTNQNKHQFITSSNGNIIFITGRTRAEKEKKWQMTDQWKHAHIKT